MKIALFHEVVNGGARRGANEFAKALQKLGHQVDLYIVDEQKHEAENQYYDHVILYPFKAKPWTGNDWVTKLYKDTIEIYLLFQLHKKIAKEVTAKKYDFVFVHPSQYTQAPFLLQLLDIPTLYYCQEPLRMIYESEMDKTAQLSIFKRYYERMTRKFRKTIDKKNIQHADIILANSTFTQKNILSSYILKSFVCHMGVDIKRFYQENVKKDIDILYIGSEDPIDGFDLFQHALGYLIGKPKIEYLLRGKKWLSNDIQLRMYYSRAKIVICFGKKEPFGLIPLEAMACGAVVVALDEGGYKDSVIHKKTGILVREDPQSIASEIDYLLKNDAIRTKMSEYGRKEIKHHWTWEKSANTVIKYYDAFKNRNPMLQ